MGKYEVYNRITRSRIGNSAEFSLILNFNNSTYSNRFLRFCNALKKKVKILLKQQYSVTSGNSGLRQLECFFPFSVLVRDIHFLPLSCFDFLPLRESFLFLPQQKNHSIFRKFKFLRIQGIERVYFNRNEKLSPLN